MKLTKKFTLIELLVVVAIIGILASLLMPSLSRARAKARSSVCTANLKQMHLAVEMWLDDNDTYMVPASWNAVTWKNSIKPYIADQTLRCPELSSSEDARYGYFAFAGTKSKGSKFQRVKRENVSNPAGAIIIMDSYFWNMQDIVFDKENSKMHNNGSNIIYMDGHIRREVELAVQVNDFDNPDYWYKWSYQAGR